MTKILFTYNLLREEFEPLNAHYDVVFPEGDSLNREELLEKVKDAEVLCASFGATIDREVIDRGTQLRLIANYGVGYNNIDVAYALEKGITIANTPDPVIEPTANLALGLLIDAARRISEYDRKLRREGRNLQKGLMLNLGTHISGQVLGIIGMGRIGKALCKRANACGMEVIYHNRRQLHLEEETSLNVEYAELDELLEKSDFISINAPLTEQTFHLIGAVELQKMKKHAILINTSRGPLVDEAALIQALKNGTIRAAALDVFEHDDIPSDELLELENIVVTPHIGTQTLHARQEMARTVVNNVIGFLEGDRRVYKVIKP